MSTLVPVPKIHDSFTWWPYATEGTYRLIRLGKLRAVKVGRNVFVTRELLEDFIERHTEPALDRRRAELATIAGKVQP